MGNITDCHNPIGGEVYLGQSSCTGRVATSLLIQCSCDHDRTGVAIDPSTSDPRLLPSVLLILI